MTPDTRWIQRFQNFDRACLLLRDGLSNGSAGLSFLEKEGIIQRFEYSFELGWKTLKDFLEQSGVVINPVTPRQVLKEGCQAKILADGQIWIDMMEHRNLLSHTYDVEVFEEAVEAIETKYLPALLEFHEYLKSQLPQ